MVKFNMLRVFNLWSGVIRLGPLIMVTLNMLSVFNLWSGVIRLGP